MLQAISKYLRCESQILKDMLKQEHDQIDDVKDVINHNVSDAKDEIIAELENTKKEVLDCIKDIKDEIIVELENTKKEVLDCIKIELKEHMNQLFESFQGKINQQLQLQQKAIKEEIVKRKNDTISGRVVKLWSPKGGKK